MIELDVHRLMEQLATIGGETVTLIAGRIAGRRSLPGRITPVIPTLTKVGEIVANAVFTLLTFSRAVPIITIECDLRATVTVSRQAAVKLR